MLVKIIRYVLAGITFLLFLNPCFGRSDQLIPRERVSPGGESDTASIIKGVFDIPELVVAPSPDSVKRITFPLAEKVVDYDISPAGMQVAALICDKQENCFIKFWQIGKCTLSDSLFSTPNQLRRLVICPRPFITGYDARTESDYYSYRLFLGMDNGNRSFRIKYIG